MGLYDLIQAHRDWFKKYDELSAWKEISKDDTTFFQTEHTLLMHDFFYSMLLTNHCAKLFLIS